MVKLSTDEFVLREFTNCFNNFIAHEDDKRLMGRMATGGLKDFPILYEHVFRRPASDLKMFRDDFFRKMQSEDLSNHENLKRAMNDLYEIYREVASYKSLTAELKSQLEKDFFEPAKKFFKELDSKTHTKYFSKKLKRIPVTIQEMGADEFFKTYAPETEKLLEARERENEREPTLEELTRHWQSKLALLEDAKKQGAISNEQYEEERQQILVEMKNPVKQTSKVPSKRAKEFVKKPYIQPETEIKKNKKEDMSFEEKRREEYSEMLRTQKIKKEKEQYEREEFYRSKLAHLDNLKCPICGKGNINAIQYGIVPIEKFKKGQKRREMIFNKLAKGRVLTVEEQYLLRSPSGQSDHKLRDPSKLFCPNCKTEWVEKDGKETITKITLWQRIKRLFGK